MSVQKNKTDNDYVATFTDFKHLLQRSWKKIVYTSLAFGLLGLFYSTTRPVLYPITASFKEMGKTEGGQSGGTIGIILGGMSGTQQSDAISWMQSSKLVKRIIQRLDLQGNIEPKKGIGKHLDRILNNVKLEYAILTRQKSPGIHTLERPYKLSHVYYNGEIPISYDVNFFADGHYTLKNSQGKKVGEGILGEPFTMDNASFTIIKNGISSFSNNTFSLTLEPLETLTANLQNKIEFESDKNDKELILISFNYLDRFDGAEIINQMMVLYKEHQEEEQRRITNSQIAYLEKRQSEARKNLENAMDRLVEEQAADVESSGFPNSSSALEFLGARQKEQSHKMMILDLEIQKLKKVLEEGCAYYDRFHMEGDTTIINNLLNETRSLKQQADAINLSLHQYLPEGLENSNLIFAKQMSKLEETQQTLSELKALVEALQEDSLLTPSKKLLTDPRFMIQSWYDKMMGYKEELHWGKLPEEEWQKHKEQYLVYLNNLTQLYRVHEKSIKERIAQHGDVKDEFQGINLTTSKELFLENSRKLSNLEAEILQYQFVIEKLQDPHFSINSLQTILNDPISNSIITNYSQLLLSLKDQGHRSEKEQERIKNELLLQRNFLAMHLAQTVQIKTLTTDLIRKRIYTLQNLSLALIQQQISLLEMQLHDYISDRINHLTYEKTVVFTSINNLKKEMAKLPKRWYAEQVVGQQLEMSQNFGKEITRLVESKNITTNLEVIKSTPVDVAVPPFFPKKPHISLFTIAGVIAGALMSLFYITLNGAMTGLRASEDNLRELNMHISGTLSQHTLSISNAPVHDTVLATMRKIIGHLCRKATEENPIQNAAIVIGLDEENFTKELAAVAHVKGLKVLILPLVFHGDDSTDHETGLLQYLEGSEKTPTIYKDKRYDYIVSGGISRFGPELISSSRFHTLFTTLCHEYDWVICYSNAAITSVEGESLLHMYCNICACLKTETLEELRTLIELANNDSTKRITSVFIND